FSAEGEELLLSVSFADPKTAGAMQKRLRAWARPARWCRRGRLACCWRSTARPWPARPTIAMKRRASRRCRSCATRWISSRRRTDAEAKSNGEPGALSVHPVARPVAAGALLDLLGVSERPAAKRAAAQLRCGCPAAGGGSDRACRRGGLRHG